ncbi:MAG: division/cell wall cluster transcriptional repressor MraZ [Nitrospirota bacterium]|nr:division/cell wall cluster transcriptional repressor MraZ [Nitrospirota bacterium]
MSRGFCGEHHYNLDAKGRLSIPSEIRKVLAENYEEKVILTKDPVEGYLVAYPLEVWGEHEEKVKKLGSTAAAKKYIRIVFSAAVECELDKQGRILLPPSLRDYAGLSREAVVVGASTRIEIWDKERYMKNNVMSEGEMEELAKLGI